MPFQGHCATYFCRSSMNLLLVMESSGMMSPPNKKVLSGVKIDLEIQVALGGSGDHSCGARSLRGSNKI